MDPRDVDRKIRAAFGPRSLGVWPTPLEASPALAARGGLAQVWVKREDRSATVYGGNKVRGLEFLFRDLGPGDVVVTIGGSGSTHCLAAARHARALGARTVLAQFPQGHSDTERRTARASGEVSTHVFQARTWLGFPVSWLAAWISAGRIGGRRRLYIPGGGATPVAVLGHVLAGLELPTQLQSPPDAILTPLGSGGTAAGLLLACRLLEWKTRIVAVQVASRFVANAGRVFRLASRARELLAAQGVPLPHAPASAQLLVLDGMGAGYGEPTAPGERARGWGEEAGLTIDSTYGGKTLALLPELSRMGFARVVFWHTYASPERDA